MEYSLHLMVHRPGPKWRTGPRGRMHNALFQFLEWRRHWTTHGGTHHYYWRGKIQLTTTEHLADQLAIVVWRSYGGFCAMTLECLPIVREVHLRGMDDWNRLQPDSKEHLAPGHDDDWELEYISSFDTERA